MKARLSGLRSLPGQMALLVAIALFVAQAINFGLLLHARNQAHTDGTAAQIASRILETAERVEAGGRPPGERGGVRLVDADPIDHRLERQPEIETAVGRLLRENNLKVAATGSSVRAIGDNDPAFVSMNRFRAERLRHAGAELSVAVAVPGRGWFITRQPWQLRPAPIVAGLIAQTLILYGIMLVPLLWIGLRISRPLRTLASAARGFIPGADDAPLDEAGPDDVRSLIAAFNALRTRVTAMLDEKDHMLGAIGHDLRTPLAALRVRVEGIDDEAERARAAETIAEMSRMLDDILSLARLGRPSEAPTEVDVAALVDAVVEDFRDLGHEIAFDEPTRLAMRLRPTLMRRAVRNLIENAIKYGGDVAVSLGQDREQVAITVSDRGPGIPVDRLEAVFDPFTRLEGSRNSETGGIGLGLALARAIVREARGDIRLENRAEGGLAATIVLPR